MKTKLLARAGVVALAAATGLVAVPGGAVAETCGDDGTRRFFDPTGSFFDFTDAGATPERFRPFAALGNGGSNGPDDTPPGSRRSSDAFDDWGALFVGGTAVSDMYFSPDNNGCVSEEAGAERVYPPVVLHGLQVQRKVYVRPSAAGGLPGARILNLLTNDGPAPVTTSVQVGDNEADSGDLGSDDDTAVRSSSSADPVASVGDRWFATSDHDDDGGETNDDPAIAFVVDGPTGLTSAATVQVGGGGESSLEDNVVWSWLVTIQPGETVALMSFVVLAEAADGPAQASRADALTAHLALAYQSAPAEQLYAGMSATEIAALRNWNDLEVKGQLAAPKRQQLRKRFSAQLTCPEEACRADLTGKIRVGKRSFRLKPVQRQAATGTSTRVTFELSKKSVKKVRALVKAKPGLRRHLRAKVTGTVSDLTATAQQRVTATWKVKAR